MSQEPYAYAGAVEHPLAGRRAKPRSAGQTMVIDKGLGLAETRDLLELAGPYIDYIKLGFGTAALYPERLLRAKVELIRSFGVEPYPGGTFLEVALLQGRLEAYLRASWALGFTTIEVSDGTIDLSPAERAAAIAAARSLGFDVITEVGKKDGASELDASAALAQVRADLAQGACKVILEGRESGKGVGIYDDRGRLKKDDLAPLIAGLERPDAVMWEAPLKAQQQELIALFGPNVNLGNVAPGEVMALEALRCGLRGDTLRLALEGNGAPEMRGAGTPEPRETGAYEHGTGQV